MRKAAQYIFATPPSSSFEEALQHFEEAEKRELNFYELFICPFTKYLSIFSHPLSTQSIHCVVNPGFYSSNWLYIGKCYIKLGKHAEAKPWLQKTAGYNGVLLGDDIEVGYKQIEVLYNVMVSIHYIKIICVIW